MITVEEITNGDGFRALGGEWEQLLQRCAGATVFSTFTWLFAWWQVYGGARQLLILAARDEGGELVGLAPLITASPGAFDGLAGERLELIGAGPSDYGGVIAVAGREAEVCAASLKALRRHGRRWALSLGEVPRQTPTVEALLEGARALRYRVRSSVSNTCPYLCLPDSWEECVQSLGPRMRKHVPYYIRRLIERDGCRLHLVARETERVEAMEALAGLHEKRWRDRTGSGNWANPRFAEFHERVSRGLLADGRLRLSVLYHGAAPIAALYGFRYGERFCYYQSGFDPAWAKHSPATAMIALAVKAAIEEGAREFDFMRGASEYKQRWASGERTNLRVEIWPSAWAKAESSVRAFAHRGANAVGRRVAGALRRTRNNRTDDGSEAEPSESLAVEAAVDGDQCPRVGGRLEDH